MMSVRRFEDTKEVNRICKSKKDRQQNGQKKKDKRYKQRSTKHTYKAIVTSNTNPTKTWSERGCSGRGKQFLLHWWHLSCYSSYKYSDKS